MDMRVLIITYAQGLRFLCEAGWTYVNSTMITNVDGFIYTPSVIPTSLLKSQIQQMIDTMTTISPQLASNSMALFSYSVESQMFINAFGTNAMIYISSKSNNEILISKTAYQMEDGSLCTCLPVVKCTAPAAIYWTNTTKIYDVLSINMNKTYIRGMKTDCYPLDGLMASTLECFFDQSCLQLLVGNTTSVITLNTSFESRYLSTDPVEKIMSTLFMEKLTFSYSREAYYQQCGPKLCTYSYVHKNTLLTLITTIIGFVSGLDTILRFLLPKMVRLLMKLKQKFWSSTQNDLQAFEQSSISGKQGLDYNLK